MERLNDIVNRSTLRRSQRAEQRAELQKSLQEGQAPPQSPRQYTQRPKIEQDTNPAPRRPSYPPQPAAMQKTQGLRRFSSAPHPELAQVEQPVQRVPRQYGANPQRSPLSPQRLADYGANTYRESEQGEQATRSPKETTYLSPSHDVFYYHTDDAIPVIESDVQLDEYMDEEEKEDEHSQHVYYTTWEDEYELRKQPGHTRTRVVADTITTYATNTYELPPIGPNGSQPGRYNSRSLRNVRPASNSLPAMRSPESHSPEITRSGGRNTQPLNPRYDYTTGPARTPENDREIPSQGRANRQLVPHNPIYIQPNPPEVGIFISPVAKPICQKCRGAGYLRANVPFGHPNFGKPVACICKEAERKDKRRNQLREMSNMDAFRDSTFSTFNTRTPGVKEAFEAARNYAERLDDSWLVFIGPNGCGKTHLAAAIANQCLESGAVVLFSVVPDLLDHLRAAFAPTATEVYDQLFSKMREAEVLILDDLGAQQSSPWANEKLFQLLNYRYNERLPTVITANPKGLQGMDERIRSRLGDIGLAETIHFNYAQDYRAKRGR